MKRNLILTLPVLLLVASGQAYAQDVAPAQTAQPQAAPRAKLTFADRIKQHVGRLGGTVDKTKGTADMVVSTMPDQRGGRLTIVISNDQRKSLVGFYIYNFGSLKNLPNKEEVYKYLLLTNDDITIGSFFVDAEEDIGYKYLMSATQPINQIEFDQVYLTMAAVARERRAKIRDLLGDAKKDDNATETKKPQGEKQP